ncbi:MAG: 50S ribosomal protein L9 [Phycisphaeraceae bacterium]|nr:50S ribosomal protein L9 [Phycisphaerae bacterium]MBX3391529.1 50S ribosomal protein L9 [Phycisphaeraceae bacterium]
MARNLKLLLTENVEALGIVGDVVNVRTGYARNYLLPRNLATEPSEDRIKALAVKRAEAERMLAEQRKLREALSEKLVGVEVHLTRSCNDQGILYAAVTQHEIADALVAIGHAVKPRDVRLSQVIKRVDTYDIHIKLDSDLDATIKLWVVADRKLEFSRGGDSHDDAVAAAVEPAVGEKVEAIGEARPEGKARSADRKPDRKSDSPGELAAGESKPEVARKAEKKEKKAPKDRTAEGKSTEKSSEKGSDKGGSKWSRPSEQSFDFGLRPAREKGDRRR